MILDNLSSHKVAGVQEAITATGATVLYLPPYSPDLNPIESSFPNSRRCSAKQPNERPTPYGRKSGNGSTPSPQANAQTTSPPLDTIRIKANPL